MKAFYLFCFGFFSIYTAFAQCNGRYESEIFSDVTVTTQTYSTSNNLELDVYTPTGNIETNRPLVILAHGGSFVSGSKTNPVMVEMANALAKRGYVAASISYRLISFSSISNPSQYVDGVVKGLGDGRAAIRYFYKDVIENGNTFNIDTNQIYFGGNSAGGVIGLHAGFLDPSDSTGPEFTIALNANGGIEGNSGNAGYSSKLAGVISLAGGLADVDFVQTTDTDKLLITCHGDQDNVVPYTCGAPLGQTSLPELCGGGSINLHTSAMSSNSFHALSFPGEAHCPWNSNATIKTETFNFVFEKLYQSLPCSWPVGINENAVSTVDLFPNPTQNNVTINTTENIITCRIMDLNGKQQIRSGNEKVISLNHLQKGVYFIEIETPSGIYTKKVVKI
ncbi:MAG: T9SS type A sorting domain-containing protein [Flavobacteriales bacterium]